MTGNAGFSPKFVRAKVTFSVDGATFQAGEHLVNAAGVPGFAWTHFDPLEYIGREANVALEIMAARPQALHCRGIFTCEQTDRSMSLGLFFELSADQKEVLNGLLASDGVLPDYIRKFPRIPFNDKIGVMPSRAIIRFFAGNDDIIVVCDMENLSPSGFQVYTEDRRVQWIKPAEIVRVQLQPRGGFPQSVHLNANVKRIIHSVDFVTRNRRWYFGLSITTISNEHRAAFTELLRQIVLGMKK